MASAYFMQLSNHFLDLAFFVAYIPIVAVSWLRHVMAYWRPVMIVRAKKAFTLVELMIVLAVIAIIAAFAIPSLMKARSSANETSAVGTLRTFLSAQATYMNRNQIYGLMLELHAEGLIDNALANGKKSGYLFGELDTGSDYAYTICSMPIEDGRSGSKEFCVTQEGTIFEAEFDSTGNTLNPAGGDLEWDPTEGTGNVPSQFVEEPANNTATWKPIN